MRHLVQFVIPALIFVGVVLLLGRRRGDEPAQREGAGARKESDTRAVLVILALGAAVAIVATLALQSFWS